MAPTLDASFTLPAAPLAVRAARSAVDDVLTGLGVNHELASDIRLCVSEAVTNAVRHGYDGAAGPVDIEVLHDAREVTVVVRDRGRGLTARTPSDIGGYGLAIVDRLTSRHAIRTGPDTGTELELVFPLAARYPASDARVSRAAARA